MKQYLPLAAIVACVVGTMAYSLADAQGPRPHVAQAPPPYAVIYTEDPEKTIRGESECRPCNALVRDLAKEGWRVAVGGRNLNQHFYLAPYPPGFLDQPDPQGRRRGLPTIVYFKGGRPVGEISGYDGSVRKFNAIVDALGVPTRQPQRQTVKVNTNAGWIPNDPNGQPVVQQAQWGYYGAYSSPYGGSTGSQAMPYGGSAGSQSFAMPYGGSAGGGGGMMPPGGGGFVPSQSYYPRQSYYYPSYSYPQQSYYGYGGHQHYGGGGMYCDPATGMCYPR